MNPFLLLALIGGGIFLASKYMGSSSSSSAPSFDALLKEFEASPGLQTSVRNMMGKSVGGVTVDSLKAQWAASGRDAFDNASYELGAGALMPWPTKSAGDDAARAWLLKMGRAFYDKGRTLGTENLDGKRPGLTLWGNTATASENVRWLPIAQDLAASALAVEGTPSADAATTVTQKVREAVDGWLNKDPRSHVETAAVILMLREMIKDPAFLAKLPPGTVMPPGLDAKINALVGLEKERAARLGAPQADLDIIKV